MQLKSAPCGVFVAIRPSLGWRWNCSWREHRAFLRAILLLFLRNVENHSEPVQICFAGICVKGIYTSKTQKGCSFWSFNKNLLSGDSIRGYLIFKGSSFHKNLFCSSLFHRKLLKSFLWKCFVPRKSVYRNLSWNFVSQIFRLQRFFV